MSVPRGTLKRMAQYQNDGKCPLCGGPVYRRTVSLPDLDSTFNKTIEGPLECRNQRGCGWFKMEDE